MFEAEHRLAETDTRSLVSALLRAGWSQAKIAQVLGLSKSTVCYHARRLERPSNPRCARRYDWTEIQRDDNRIENLAILCPNCHSQTENFGGRNVRRAA